MKYRKKPVVIEAFQWRGETQPNADWPDWARVAWETMKVRPRNNPVFMVIETLEGSFCASENDFIIRGVKGELYPCKPDIFEETYERIEP